VRDCLLAESLRGHFWSAAFGNGKRNQNNTEGVLSSLVSHQPARWRIVLALIRKEILNILQHPHYLLLLFLPVFMSLMFSVLFPALGFQDDRMRIAIAAPDDAALVLALEAVADIDVVVVADKTAVLSEIMAEAIVGVVLPDGFETAVAAGTSPTLTLYLNDNAPDSFQARAQQIVSEKIWALRNETLPAQLTWELTDGEAVDQVNISVNNYLFLTAAVVGLSMVGIGVLPQSMTEEKEQSALVPLFASPVTYADYTIAKVAVGLVYTTILTTLITLINAPQIHIWWLAITGFLLGAIFYIGIGLILGMQLKSKQQCNAWTGFMILFFFLPIWFSAGSLNVLPVGIAILLQLIPTHHLVNIFNFAVTGNNNNLFAQSFLLFMAIIVLIYAVVTWMVKKRPLQHQF
jgi:ABC-type Na+ efflux pump permease subunit